MIINYQNIQFNAKLNNTLPEYFTRHKISEYTDKNINIIYFSCYIHLFIVDC